MTQRLTAATNYMFDAFLISLCLIFIDIEIILPLAFVWLLLNALAAVAAFLVFMKKPYHLGIALGIGACLMGLGLFLGLSIGIVLFFFLVMVYRLHMRFTASEEDFETDHHFLFKFCLLFTVVLFISFLNPAGGKSFILYTIALSAISFYVIFRMLYRFMQSGAESSSVKQVVMSILSILGLSAIGGTIVFLFADETRYTVSSVLGGAIGIILWPLAIIMEKLVDFLNGLAPADEIQQNLSSIETGEKPEQPADLMRPAAADFPFELIFIGVLLVLAVVLILWLRKRKPEKTEEKKGNPVEIERFAVNSAAPEKETAAFSYAMMDLDQIREAFRDFERDAAEFGKGRKTHETVREWLTRMDWHASKNFYDTYDFVRYGKGQVSEEKALPFLEEIIKIKEKYLKINV